MHLSPETLTQLTALIRQWTGLALGSDKAYLIRHRLAPVVRSCGFAGFDDLLLRLQATSAGSSKLQDAVVEAITTKETSFFRDPWLFDALLQNVLPELVRQAVSSRRRVRIWSAGTSTGQEAYSLAIIVREFLYGSTRPNEFRDADISLLASDISGEAIDVARTGLFSQSEVAKGLSEARQRRFLAHNGDARLMNESLRKLVQFRVANLLRPSPEPGPFDLILCRNVLIYFDEPTRASVCRSLHSALRGGGWLVIGSAESLYGMSEGWEAVKFGRAFVYRKQVE